MTKTSKNLGIAGTIISIVFSALVTVLAILAIIGTTLITQQGIESIFYIGSIVFLIVSFGISLILYIVILVFLKSKNKKRVFTAGIMEIVVAGLSLLSLLTSNYGFLNIVPAGLMLASGIMICVEYSKYKKENKNNVTEENQTILTEENKDI
ncbi:hypothetical protein [Spiroplasma endosymbiont of Cantharis rufa]|uniref:hypothetical protein n=1 Tax=Spiroplasma endosymbiont of Cantharis rufa TaxID=3066279 RepID=UPI0030D04133